MSAQREKHGIHFSLRQRLSFIVFLIAVGLFLAHSKEGFAGSEGSTLAPALKSPATSKNRKPPKVRGRVYQKMLPDLSVELYGPQGDNALSVYIHNKGSADAGAFSISFSCKRWPQAEHHFWSKCSLPDINFTTGLKKKKTTFVKIPKSSFKLKKGYTYSIMVTVDSDKKVSELNENNNFAVKEFTYQ